VNRRLQLALVPLLALAIFAFLTFQTIGALKASGAWSGVLEKRGKAASAQADDPFAPIATLLDHPQAPLPANMREPFVLGSATGAVATHGPVVRKPAKPAAPAQPVLTAIVWDADPRAIVRWQGRDWTVHSGALFDEFQVVAITPTQVTISRNGESIVLQRKPPGE
jgi:hypothetical protein